MRCPECGFELEYHDFYGKTVHAKHYYTYPRSIIKRNGDIYKCPNCEGFEDESEAVKYAEENNIEYKNVEDIVCESACFNGFFHTDSREELKEGHPC